MVRRRLPSTASPLHPGREEHKEEEDDKEEGSDEGDNEEEEVEVEVRRSPWLAGTPVAVSPAVVLPAVTILLPLGKRVRGGPAGKRGELVDQLNPEVPGPFIGPLPLAGTGWEDIDRLRAEPVPVHEYGAGAGADQVGHGHVHYPQGHPQRPG